MWWVEDKSLQFSYTIPHQKSFPLKKEKGELKGDLFIK